MKPFVNRTAHHGNVVVNFRRNPIGDLPAFALGYKEAARALRGQFEQNGYADYDGYPILYLYRHSLELYLKAIVYRGAELMRLLDTPIPKVTVFQNHGLSRLLPATRAIFQAMDWRFEGTEVGSFTEFEKLVEEIESFDSSSYSFRYPIDRSGEAHLPHHFVINVSAFGENLDAVLELLDGATTALEEEFDAVAERAYEVRHLVEEDRANYDEG